MDWLQDPGFFGTHATIGRRHQSFDGDILYRRCLCRLDSGTSAAGDAHHWLMFCGMLAMVGFFTAYYLFRQLGVSGRGRERKASAGRNAL